MSATLAVLAAVALVGCSGGSSASGKSAQEMVRAAATKTLDEGTSKVALDTSLSGASVTQGKMSASGEMDYTKRRGYLILDLTASGAQGNARRADMVYEGNVFYLKLPELQQMLPNAKQWFKVDLDAVGKQLGGGELSGLTQLQQTDPRQALAYLRGASADTKEVGKEEIRGTPTTHYRMTLDLNKAAAEMPQADRKSVDEAIQTLGTSTVPADVWIDGDGRLRQMTFAQDMSKLRSSSGTGQGTANVKLELFDFGTSVNAQIPPADQVTDFSQVLAQFQQGGTQPSNR